MFIKASTNIVLALTLTLGSTFAYPAVLTFDEFPVWQSVVPHHYAGLIWKNSSVLDASSVTTTDSGYAVGMVSANNIVYNPLGSLSISAKQNFTFTGAYFTAAWNDGLTLVAEGFNNGVELFNQSFTIDTKSPTFLNFNFVGIDNLVLRSFGGSENPKLVSYGDGTQFVMDNFTFSQQVSNVPLPAAAWLFLSGVVCLGLGRQHSCRQFRLSK